tara:strand:- start:15 stop:722 length:708 start_codon:yes stop_codon:yes gene_type:complete
MSNIYLNGTAINAGKLVKFNGTDMANVYLNGTKLWTAYTPPVNIYTSSTTEQLNDNLGTINIQLSGGGGGGGGPEAVDGANVGGVGGTSSVVVYTSAGSPRTGTGALNITAAGGASGGFSGNGQGSPLGSTGDPGDSFSHGSASEPPFTNAAGGGAGAGGAIPSAGGGGMTNPNGSNSGGSGGGAGAYNSTTYTIVDVTDYLVITIGAGGAGNQTIRDGGAGSGARGVVRTLGIV